jgi:hypothetical protein
LISRALVALLGIAVLGFALWQAGRRGLADMASLRANADLMAWAQAGKVPSFERWDRAEESLRAAQRLAPGDAAMHDRLARAYEVVAVSPAVGASRDTYLDYALLHFRQVTSMRPAWPYAWMGVATQSYRLGRVNDELFGALARAMRYGPWEPGVQLGASEIGLALWDRLDPPLREQVRQNWRRTAYRQSEALARLAVAHGRQKLLCAENIAQLKVPLQCDKR